MFRLQVSPGLELRLFEPADAGELYLLVDRNREYLREWLPWVDGTRSPEDVATFIERARRQYLENQSPQAAILIDGRIAGSVGCHEIDWGNRNTSIGYWLEASRQGSGLMTRCCAAMLDYLFDELELHRVTIQCGEANHRSCAIPQRLGFLREGLLREAEWVNGRWLDLVLWGMLKEDWRRPRRPH